MFEERNKNFFKRRDLNDDRQEFAVSLRKKKRHNLANQKRVQLIYQELSPTPNTSDLEITIDILDQATNGIEKLNLWNGIRNTVAALKFTLPNSIFEKLISAISNHLNFKYSSEILECVTCILCNITCLPDEILCNLNLEILIPSLLLLFKSQSLKVQENSIWSISNLFATNFPSVHTTILELKFWKRLRKITYDPELFPIISWSSRNCSCLIEYQTENTCKQITEICSIILNHPDQSDETLSHILSSLSHVARFGATGIEYLYSSQAINHVLKLFSIFPSASLKIVGYILLKQPKHAVDLIEHNLLNELYEVIGRPEVMIKVKTWWVLDNLCKTGSFAMYQLVKHPIFIESLEIPLGINTEGKFAWINYVKSLLNRNSDEFKEGILTEKLLNTVLIVSEDLDLRVKVRCCSVFWVFYDVWGKEKFFMSEAGCLAKDLMEDDKVNVEVFDEDVMMVTDEDC